MHSVQDLHERFGSEERVAGCGRNREEARDNFLEQRRGLLWEGMGFRQVSQKLEGDIVFTRKQPPSTVPTS